MTDKLTDQVSYILYAYWYRESSQKFQLSILNSSRENYIFYIAVRTGNLTVYVYLDKVAGLSNLFPLSFWQSHPGKDPENDEQDSEWQEGVLVQLGN